MTAAPYHTDFIPFPNSIAFGRDIAGGVRYEVMTDDGEVVVGFFYRGTHGLIDFATALIGARRFVPINKITQYRKANANVQS